LSGPADIVIQSQLFGTLGYAEEEFWSSCLKLLVIIIFVLAGIVFNCGGGPAGSEYDSYIGGKFWQDPGAFANGFKGVYSQSAPSQRQWSSF
jgi:amino acid transporter